jgi:stress response protein YsnF
MEQPVERQVDLREETISVERRQPITGSDAPAGAIAERVIEVKQRAEEPVVEKRARVTEEVVVRREDRGRTETVRDTVRGTDVEVERGGVLENRDR